jgi:DNA-binding LacI/PurR family transcriptional regulator
LVNECVSQQIPVVGINRQPDIPFVDYVCSDNVCGATLAAGQLVGNGCRRFGWLNTAHSTWAGRMRGEAFYQALSTLGVDTTRDLQALIAPTEGYDGGFQAALSADANPEGSSAPMRSSPAVFLTECASAADTPRTIFSSLVLTIRRKRRNTVIN